LEAGRGRMAEMTGRGYAGTEAAFGLYRGDELLGVGTAAELAERFGVRPSTIAFYATPANLRRVTPDNYAAKLIAVKIN